MAAPTAHEDHPLPHRHLPISSAYDIEALAECLAERAAKTDDYDVLVVPEDHQPTGPPADFAGALLLQHHDLQAAVRNRMVGNDHNTGFRFRPDHRVQVIINLPSQSNRDIWTVIAEQELDDQTRATDAERADSMAHGRSA